jgi:hypothetical protein
LGFITIGNFQDAQVVLTGGRILGAGQPFAISVVEAYAFEKETSA